MSEAVIDHLEVVEVQEHNGHVLVSAFIAGERLIDAVVEEGSVGQTRQGVVKGQMGQVVFETLLFRDVAEAPHPTDDFARHVLRLGESLKDPAVDELQGVIAFGFRLSIEINHAGDKRARINELIRDVLDDSIVVASGDEVGRQSPHVGELAIETGDGSIGADDEQSVGGRLQCRVQERRSLAEIANGVAQLHLGRDARRDVVRGDDESAHRRVVHEADDRQFVGDHLFTAATKQAQRLHHGLGRAGTSQRVLDRHAKRRTVRRRHDVGERLALNGLGVVPQHPRHRPRDRFDVTRGGDEHHDRGRVVDQ